MVPVRSRTLSQVLTSAGPDAMAPPGVLALANQPRMGWYQKVRLMRRDATLGFLRDVFMAPILSSEWSVECDDPEYEDAVPYVKENTLKFRVAYLRDVLRGLLDFGWQAHEIVKRVRPDGTYAVVKMKGLLQDLSTILVDQHGELLGVRNTALFSARSWKPVYLYRGSCSVIYRDAEGTNWYGDGGLMRRCERPYDSWIEGDDAARRFDNKVAGATWVVYYPAGTTPHNGVETDNQDIAREILNTLYSSGKVAIPVTAMRAVDDLNNLDSTKVGWRVELVSAQVQQASFVDRAKYVDALKARGIGIPERAIFEGQFGTKAEAGEHADFAIDNLEMTHRDILALFNPQVVDPLLELSYGPEYAGHVQVTATPLDDDKRDMLRKVYEQHLGTENGQAMESERVDYDAIRKQLDIPTRQEQAAGGILKGRVPTEGLRYPPESADREDDAHHDAGAKQESSLAVSRTSRRARYEASRRGPVT